MISLLLVIAIALALMVVLGVGVAVVASLLHRPERPVPRGFEVLSTGAAKSNGESATEG